MEIQEAEFHAFINRLLKAIPAEPDKLTKTALKALYELTRLAFYIDRKDRVGYSEKGLLAARAFADLVAALETDLNVPPGTVAKKIG